jgi:hypothetical protein
MNIPDTVFTDDYGVALYKCRYTGELVGGENAKIIGATVPGVKSKYVMSKSEAAKLAKIESDNDFHESEANCNTCRNLCRVPHNKIPGGFLTGKCINPKSEMTPYKASNTDLIMFHPNDPMHMPCYIPRWTPLNP